MSFPCEKISFDSEGNVWVLSKTKNQISRWLQSSNYDSVQTIGGLGLQKEALQSPEKILPYSRNMIFVSDQDGSRILLINNNLKPIRSLTIDNFNNPDIRRFQSFTNSIQGLFVLAQNTNKIFKINEFSKIETEFGGWDTGNMVENPIDILSNDKNQLFVIDTTTQSISVFSTYGILEKNITPLLPFRWNQVKICDNLLLFFHSGYSQVAVYNLSTQTHQIIDLSVNFIDIDFNIYNKEIIILQKNKWIIQPY